MFVEAYAPVNGMVTVILAPDGSKEGWSDSDTGDRLREEFIEYLGTYNYEDDSSPWDWVEVEYGEYGQKVLRGNKKLKCQPSNK